MNANSRHFLFSTAFAFVMISLTSFAFCQDYQWSYTSHSREAVRLLKQQPSSERKNELNQLLRENQLILITNEELNAELKKIEAFKVGDSDYEKYLKENLNAIRDKYIVVEDWFNLNK